MATKEEVESLLSFGEKFDAWARQRITAGSRATAIAAKAGRERIIKQREEEQAKKLASLKKQEVEDTQVEYVLSLPRWKGVADFYYTKKTCNRRNAVLVLDEPPISAGLKESKLFPQLLITPKHGKAVVVTLLACRGWEVGDVVARGVNVSVEIRRCA